MASPLTSLVLAPFLTKRLSISDYGLLVVLNTAIGLVAGITQLGLSSAFFRAYSYDYSSPRDRASVLTTAIALLFPVALVATVVAVLMAGPIATGLLGRPSSEGLVAVAVAVVVLQNLTVPAFAWLRAEGRAASFAVVSSINLAVTLSTNLVLVGSLNWGVAGSLVASGAGYGSVLLAMAPVLVRRFGLPRIEIARNMLGFGVPQVPNVLAMWVLQLSDRYLLTLLRSLDETARYAVAYSLGMAVSIVVISPFALAWPTAMYAIAKRSDERQQFGLVFTAATLLFLFLAFALSVVGVAILDRLFPISYRSAAIVIPLVSESMALFGIYMLLTVGIGLRRKTWIASALTLGAAVANVLLNLLLIPFLGALGAAISTLFAYFGLAIAGYVVNQRLHPIELPVGRLVAAIALGMLLYAGSFSVGVATRPQWALPAQILGLVVYSVCLLGLGASSIRQLARLSALPRTGESTIDPAPLVD
jgi:O-antigen/teichoic acid export membrane protein